MMLLETGISLFTKFDPSDVGHHNEQEPCPYLFNPLFRFEIAESDGVDQLITPSGQ